MRQREVIEHDVAETFREMLSKLGGQSDEQKRLIAGSLTVAVFLRETSLMLETLLDHRVVPERRQKRANHEKRNERLKLVP